MESVVIRMIKLVIGLLIIFISSNILASSEILSDMHRYDNSIISIQQYKLVLGQLSKIYNKPQDEIAKAAVKAKFKIEKFGYKNNSFEFLMELNHSVYKGRNYKHILSGIVTEMIMRYIDSYITIGNNYALYKYQRGYIY